MNKIEQYEHQYKSIRQKVRQTVIVDFSLLDEVITGAAIPIDKLLHLDDEDKEGKEALSRQTTEHLLDYLTAHSSKRNQLFDWLSPCDNRISSGALLLYGAGGTARPRQAAQLYARSRQPIIISDADESVRQKFKDTLLQRGVDDSDIVMEVQGRNYLENAYYSLLLLDKHFSGVRNVTIVTEALVARRALVATMMYADNSVRLNSFPMLVDEENRADDMTAPDTWYKTQLGMKCSLMNWPVSRFTKG